MASNDELDDLVREVIEENPPEEQGIRPEWAEHVGWHRKENIFNLRGRKERGDAASEIQNHPAQTGDSSSDALPKIQHHDALNATSIIWYASTVTVLIICVIAHRYYCKTNMSCSLKPRKTEADLV